MEQKEQIRMNINPDGLRGGYNSIHTIAVDGYNVKYSINEKDIIRISIPGFGVDMPLSDKKINDSMKNKLEERGWSNGAILRLEDLIFNKQWVCFQEMDITI